MINASKLTEDHPFSEYVRILGRGKNGSRSLTQDEAYQAMKMILAGDAEDAQVGAFLMLLRIKEETPEELAGFVQASQEHINAPSIDVDVDWSSYAGKKNQLPWSLLAAKLLAQNGTKILIHGAYGTQANRLYTETACEGLGIRTAESWNCCRSQIQTDGISYIDMEKQCPTFNNLLFYRRLLGLRSAMHSLARLYNPVKAPVSLQGIFHPSYAPSHQQASMLLGQENSASFKGEGGEAEIRPEAQTKIYAVRDGKEELIVWPKQIDFRPQKQTGLSLDHANAVWRGDAEDSYGEAATISTAALVLYLKDHSHSIESAFAAAKSLWLKRG